MNRIELTDDQKGTLKRLLTNEYSPFSASEKEMIIAGEVIEKAEMLMCELGAIEESGSDLMVWFYGKYLKEEGIIKWDDISKITLSTKQKSILEAGAKGEYISCLESKENNQALSEIIDVACSFIAETNAYKELNKSNDHYLWWFWEKYRKSQN
jgi:hypothetical protein